MTYNDIVNISNDEYHTADGYSKSSLIVYRDSPTKFYKKYILKEQEDVKESDDFLLGQLVHAMLLEPHKLNETYHFYEHISRATKAGKAQAEELQLLVDAGKILVKDDIKAQADKMVEAVKDNIIAKSIITDAEIEQSIFFTDNDTNILFKSRPDIIKGSIVADIKTCKDVNERAFQRSAVDYGYFLQAAMSKLAMQSINREFERFVNICVDKTTFEVIVYILDEQAIEYGLNQFMWLAGKLEMDLQENNWLKPRVKTLSAPRWAEWEHN